ncbi:UDP-N-acetylmuramoyl-tripeptide--D-alanyl-D-alanine ligase [Sporosarcina oncorhynchi]|uniref:UDP-N-acetylmuramoyl-tripeptide--D-alanyl-D-alanine ligase n=1 Tax=Sporosarcina oncorhynchi TaxID=3056444 RepID=A0ABZ0L912_9BACL|nr:UDP-N-acetylmuramoyl-tripeptide--D-alanyl-D-alanine ligase [Sporosarcina sp. T2O-4]WOV89026.1 UDP-N-acetylmuramoyl-tripeptide--D-alanyl-D-alanine ligase [Sporosarcina sp. T2O-4]
MKKLTVRSIRMLLDGKIISGRENWYVTDAIYYKRHEHVKSHTLLFMSRADSADWKAIDLNGPALVITDKPDSELKAALPNTTVMKVTSLVQSYWRFINYYRSLFQLPVITITGTCGKTTTKEMLKHILSADRKVHASVSSINEPRQSFPYLMGIDDTTEVAVFEHGLGNSGNIAHQCMIYQPTIGILTNVGVHHLDGCVDLEGYIRAKAEIVGGIREGGVLILNADDANTKKINLRLFTGEIIYFGTDKKAHVRASNMTFGKTGMDFIVHTENESYEAFIPGFGEHQVSNALAALAAVQAMKMDVGQAIARLRSFKEMARHLECTIGKNGCLIIDDTWTNNPTSMKAALKVVDELGKGKKTMLILGDIKRLGDFEKKYHREIGSLIAKRTIHTLITIGQKAEEIAIQAKKDGSTASIRTFKDAVEIGNLLDHMLDDQTVVLIKGPMSSRSMISFAKKLKRST